MSNRNLEINGDLFNELSPQKAEKLAGGGNIDLYDGLNNTSFIGPVNNIYNTTLHPEAREKLPKVDSVDINRGNWLLTGEDENGVFTWASRGRKGLVNFTGELSRFNNNLVGVSKYTALYERTS